MAKERQQHSATSAEGREGAPLPWERLPDERDKAWGCFVLYRDMGPSRSYAQVQRELGYKTVRQIEVYASRNRWRERVTAWDAHLDAITREGAEDAASEASRRHASVGSKAVRVASAWLDKVLASGELDALTPSQLIELAEMGVRLERQALGLPEHVKEAQAGPTVNVQVAQGMQLQQTAELDLNELLADEGTRLLLDQLAQQDAARARRLAPEGEG